MFIHQKDRPITAQYRNTDTHTQRYGDKCTNTDYSHVQQQKTTDLVFYFTY